METPLKKRLFVFAVKERSRFRLKSGLYLPNSSRGNLTRAEDVWVLNAASDCFLKWEQGKHLLITDGLELEPVDLDLWNKYKLEPAFADLNKFAEDVCGKVVTSIIHEDSILAEVEGDLYQEDFSW